MNSSVTSLRRHEECVVVVMDFEMRSRRLIVAREVARRPRYPMVGFVRGSCHIYYELILSGVCGGAQNLCVEGERVLDCVVV